VRKSSEKDVFGYLVAERESKYWDSKK